MLEFKKIEISDIEKIKKYTGVRGNYSCETSFVNLLVWSSIYHNMYAEKEGTLLIKSDKYGGEFFRLPFGNDMKKGLDLLCEYYGNEVPMLWIQQGERFTDIVPYIKENYQLEEHRDAFDYIYLQSDLANLGGKKYHSKRNHISSFSKQYNWEYRDITRDNINDVLECAKEWYKSNSDKFDEYMQCEREGIKTILYNMDALCIKGGAIYVEGKMVAFTLGSPINDEVFDVHMEKALPEYSTAYAVINNEFAKRLAEYKYINREDDMGLEGLRKAKLSYKPQILLAKYFCVPKKRICKRIYNENFGDDDSLFESRLFDTCFKYCRFLEKDGKIVSMCFALPCEIGSKDALYIFAVATAKQFRGKGYATELLNQIKNEGNSILILRPVNEGLISFYERIGFKCFNATNVTNDFKLKPCKDFLDLAEAEKENEGNFVAMYLSDKNENLENLYFPYSMP